MRELSSRGTLLYKYVVCWYAIVTAAAIAGFVIYMAFKAQTEVHAVCMCIIILVVFIIIFYVQYRRFFKVELSEESIFVSDRRQKIEVPLAQIKKVSGSGNIVEITLYKSTAFGKHIVFFHNAFYRGLVPPIINELKEKIQKAKI